MGVLYTLAKWNVSFLLLFLSGTTFAMATKFCMHANAVLTCSQAEKNGGVYIQGVTGGTDQTSGECSLGQTIPI